MKKVQYVYLILIAGIILLLLNIYNLDFKNLRNGNYWGIVSNLFLIIGMIINIRNLKVAQKQEEK